MSGDELTVFAHQQRIPEAEGDDAVCDLADLLGGMRPRVTRIGLDLADRYRLYAHAIFLDAEMRRAIGVARHAAPFRSSFASRRCSPANVSRHVRLYR